MYYQKHQSGRLPDTPIQILPEASIRKLTEFHNPECKKINVQFLYRDDFVFAQHCGVQEEKYRGVGKNCPFFFARI